MKQPNGLNFSALVFRKFRVILFCAVLMGDMHKKGMVPIPNLGRTHFSSVTLYPKILRR